MKRDNARVLTFKHPSMGKVIAITNGSNNIDDAHYMVSLGKQPNNDWETQTLKAVIGYLAEENEHLHQQVRSLRKRGGIKPSTISE